jgi:hypothetical protein
MHVLEGVGTNERPREYYFGVFERMINLLGILGTFKNPHTLSIRNEESTRI